ncbi:hypothetical protein QBC40DRAFT_288625 [Triangularia verruculosa]|uniref:MHYT domain-containing protein n=1 Tax=Triangularia verruculosa TaxID=2587418 RepID=A0AAN6X905_9PEZI|nr:hypothetical protein QBC40DRAFT_288625 [Triangularia verruculosa]
MQQSLVQPSIQADVDIISRHAAAMSSAMMESAAYDSALARYIGQPVPYQFDPALLTLSYAVSLVGAASTLELINRRTSRKGYYNNLLLLAASVTMGGVSIWCMHYIGNRATSLLNGQPELQVVYSVRVTVASFFVPILVLLAAFFVVTSTHNASGVNWWRIVVSGMLSGGAICGMHYLGNASISNYHCSYHPANVVGSAIIAVAASTVALALFFVFRASWTSSWWRRTGCAIVLAGAVSGMHWCGAVGTTYRLMHLNSMNEMDARNVPVIVISCLSVAACAVMAGTAIYSARMRQSYASKAQRITLAAAVFDKQGRVLVSPDGALPSEEITSKFLHKTQNDVFSIAHPLFHWVFQASRNWSSVAVLLGKMRNHLAELPHRGRNVRTGISLVDEDGHLIENYDVIFRELFCLAAAGLADKMNENLTDAGILWDEILSTGGQQDAVSVRSNSTGKTQGSITIMTRDADLAEKGMTIHRHNYGSLMCLVRTVDNPRVIDRLEASGYCFADPHHVAHIIGAKMQIRTVHLEKKLVSMKEYARGTMLDPGVHVGLFAVRTQVDSHHGFDILVRKQARNLLPSVELPLDRLEPVHLDFLRHLNGLSVHAILQRLQRVEAVPSRSAAFAALFNDAIRELRASLNDSILDDAKLISRVAQVPCRPPADSMSPTRLATCSLITFSIMIPIHVRVKALDYTLVPLYFFKTQQLVHPNSPHAAAFARGVHRELSPVLNSVPAKHGAKPTPPKTISSILPAKLVSRFKRYSRSSLETRQARASKLVSSSRECMAPITPSNNPSVVSLGLYRGASSINGQDPDQDQLSDSTVTPERPQHRQGPTYDQQRATGPKLSVHPHHGAGKQHNKSKSFGGMGIMISQEVTVDVDATAGPRSPAVAVDVEKAEKEMDSSTKALTHDGGKETDEILMPASPKTPRGKNEAFNQGIELQNVATVLNGGTGFSTARVEVKRDGDAAETQTFVDELFSGCLALAKY